MIRSNKFFLIAVILGILAIAGLASLMAYGDYFIKPYAAPAAEKPAELTSKEVLPEPTWKVDDLVDSLQTELKEETQALYEEDGSDFFGDEEDINALENIEL
mgnify:CR=1 FL=1